MLVTRGRRDRRTLVVDDTFAGELPELIVDCSSLAALAVIELAAPVERRLLDSLVEAAAPRGARVVAL